MTFREEARAYIEAHRYGWKNPKHAEQWRSTLEAYAYPTIGKSVEWMERVSDEQYRN